LNLAATFSLDHIVAVLHSYKLGQLKHRAAESGAESGIVELVLWRDLLPQSLQGVALEAVAASKLQAVGKSVAAKSAAEKVEEKVLELEFQFDWIALQVG
jgi:hypothetical protein